MFISEEIYSKLREFDSTLVPDKSAQDLVLSMLESNDPSTVCRIAGRDFRDYNVMVAAGQLAIRNLSNTTPKNVTEYVEKLSHILHDDVKKYLLDNQVVIDQLLIEYDWTNYRYDYISAMSMIGLYLLRDTYAGNPIEMPIHLYMRCCAHLHLNSMDQFTEAFIGMCRGEYTVPTAAMLNLGTKTPQTAACFTSVVPDTLEGISQNQEFLYHISAGKGGNGLSFSHIRHSEINGAMMSKGLVPTMKQFDDTIGFSKQGRARNGAMTMFFEPWHIDVISGIDSLDESIGNHSDHIIHSDICLWLPWVFWDRVREGREWTLFCPKYVPDLLELHGHQFTEQYELYEKDQSIPDKYKVKIDARDLLHRISSLWQKKGKPFMMNSDSANYKSNHKHLGKIKGGNLCLEIVEHNDTINVCNLSSISLSSFGKVSVNKTWDDIRKNYDFDKLTDITHICVKNLNNMIDIGYSPLTKVLRAWQSQMKDPILEANKKFRSLGLGVQGLSTLFQRMDLCFDDELAARLDETIMACILFNSLAQSIQLAVINGPCEAHIGSPASYGKFQFDLWKDEWEERWHGKGCRLVPDGSVFDPVNPADWGQQPIILTNQYGEVFTIEPSWSSLREAMVMFGLYNSLLLALMPTMSSAKPLRNSESVELHPSNLYSTDLIYGSYPVVNYMMFKDLTDLGLWSEGLSHHIINCEGQIDTIDEYFQTIGISYDHQRIEYLKLKYRGAMMISPKMIKLREFRRNKYVCQSTSSNVYMKHSNPQKLEALAIMADELGLKTIQYYLYQMSPARNVNVASIYDTLTPTDKVEKKIVCTDGMCCSA